MMFKISNSQKNVKNRRGWQANNNKPCYRDHVGQMKYDPRAKTKANRKSES